MGTTAMSQHRYHLQVRINGNVKEMNRDATAGEAVSDYNNGLELVMSADKQECILCEYGLVTSLHGPYDSYDTLLEATDSNSHLSSEETKVIQEFKTKLRNPAALISMHPNKFTVMEKVIDKLMENSACLGSSRGNLSGSLVVNDNLKDSLSKIQLENDEYAKYLLNLRRNAEKIECRKLLEWIARELVKQHDAEKTIPCKLRSNALFTLKSGKYVTNLAGEKVVILTEACNHSQTCQRPSMIALRKVLTDSGLLVTNALTLDSETIDDRIHFEESEKTKKWHLADDIFGITVGTFASNHGFAVRYHN